MTRARGRGQRHRRGTSAPRRRDGRIALIGTLLIAAAVGLLWWRPRHSAHPPEPSPATDRFTGLSPRQAYETGIRLMTEERHVESMAYFRHAMQETQGTIWEVPFGMFCALRNATLDDQEHLGLLGPTTRSSYERVSMLREAFHYLELAERAARRPRDIAILRKNRAQLMAIWGSGLDAFVAYRRAEVADPSWIETGRMAGDLVDLMRHPTRVDPPGAELPGGPVEPSALEREVSP